MFGAFTGRFKFRIGRVGHHTGGQYHHIQALQAYFLAQQDIVIDQSQVRGHALDLALDEDNAGFLRLAVKFFRRAGSAQLVEQDVDVGARICLRDLQRLLDRNPAANRGTVGQMIGIA